MRWTHDPTGSPELGLALARDPDPFVRRTLAQAVTNEALPSAVEPVRDILRKDPRYSVRRALLPAEPLPV
jgi:hypothetical protein